MTVDETRKVLQSYWEGHDPEVLAEDAVFTDVGSGAEFEGREAIQAMLDYLYTKAFAAAAEATNSVIGEGRAIVEYEFVGTHVGEFAGVESTGKKVKVPFAVAYGFADGHISRGRIYFPRDRLLEQLRA